MKQKTVLVVGLGRMGSSLVEELWDTHVEIVVIDKSSTAVDAVKDKASAAFVADASDPQVLDGVGAKDLNVAIVTLGEDFEATVLTVSTLAQRKVPTMIARAKNERQATVLRAVGATRVVLVESEMGRRLAPEVLSPASSDLMELAAAFRVVPWSARGAFVGRTLAEIDLPRRYEVTVLGYWRGPASELARQRRLSAPGADYRLEAGDTLLVIGLGTAVEKFLADEE
jgi:trk system potassium uptake protein TrkA